MTIQTAFERQTTGTVSGYGGYSVRCVIPASEISSPTGTQSVLKLTLDGSSTAIGDCYIGHRANDFDFATTPTQVTKGGLTSFTVNGLNEVMDDVSFAWDGVSDIVVSVYITSGNLRKSGGIGYHYEVAGNKASELTPVGFYGSQHNPNILTLVSKIEMDGFEEGTGDPDPEPQPEPTDRFEIFGTIRNSGGGWVVINDTDHKPENIASVADMGSFVRLTYGKTASKVGTLVITPDEVYAQSGRAAGASVGLSYADIYFSENGVAKTPAQVASTWGNFWIYGKMWE